MLSLSDAEVLFAGFELIRGIHLTFNQNARMLNEFFTPTGTQRGPAARAEAVKSALNASGISPADLSMETYNSKFEPLVQRSLDIVSNSLRYPVVIGIESFGPRVDVWTCAGPAPELAVAKMFEMTSAMLEFVNHFFLAGYTTGMLRACATPTLKLEIAQDFATMLDQSRLMMEWLSVITRDALRLAPMHTAIISAAERVAQEIKNVLGSDDSTAAIEKGLFSVVNSCSEYRVAILGYKQSGVWVKPKDNSDE